jgi:hypothetical protein
MGADQDTFAAALRGGDTTDDTKAGFAAAGPEPTGSDSLQGGSLAGPLPPVPSQAPETGTGLIPAWRLREEAERRRVAEERLTELEKSVPAPPAPGPAGTEEASAAAVAPLFRQVQQQLMFNARLAATSAYGTEKIDAAEQAFLGAFNAGRLDPHEAQRVLDSPNRWVAAVEWFDRQAVLAEVGTDPAAYRQRVLDDALKDPSFLQKAVETARAQASPGAFAPPPPRQAAAGGLPSLTRATAAAADGEEPENAAEVFTHTLRTARR